MTASLVTLAAAVLAVSAPENVTAAAPSDDIVVVGFSKPYRLTVAQLRNAARAYERGRARLAPEGRLYFQVATADGAERRGEVRLTLRSSRRNVGLSLDGEGRFVLPPLEDDDWELVADRGTRSISIQPLVLSPGTGLDDRRLGDLRLQCEVTWAIQKEHASLPERAIFGAAGGCGSRRLGLYAKADRPIRSASVSWNGRTTPVPVLSDGRSFRAPLGDRTLPDAARVHFDHP